MRSEHALVAASKNHQLIDSCRSVQQILTVLGNLTFVVPLRLLVLIKYAVHSLCYAVTTCTVAQPVLKALLQLLKLLMRYCNITHFYNPINPVEALVT
jgi:hypothetical protein